MAPNINKDDVIISSKRNNIKEGDVVVFYENNEAITHRVIKIYKEGEENRYITKGDNNNVEDAKSISDADIKGTVIIRIPFLGKFIMLLRNKIYMLIIIVVILTILIIIKNNQEKRESRREKKRIEDKKIKDKENN